MAPLYFSRYHQNSVGASIWRPFPLVYHNQNDVCDDGDIISRAVLYFVRPYHHPRSSINTRHGTL